MLLNLFFGLRQAQTPVSLREYLALLEAMEIRLVGVSMTDFYHLARAILIKDEQHFDRFDRVFGEVFKGVEHLLDAVAPAPVPDEWLRKLAERYLTEDERRQIEALGWDKLMATLRERLAEQTGRHAGGSKWIGTGGTSPFGAYGFNPEGVRIGQAEGRNRSAVKVWDERTFRDLDGDAELSPRAMKLALRRLRRFARDGAADELDLDGTIHASARQGYIEVRTRPSRRNAVAVLLLLDVGGSMDWHVAQVEQLFGAAKAEFKHLTHAYFHNCLYGHVWTENERRQSSKIATLDLLHRHPPETRVVFVGDAAMSPYEITQAGGAVDHINPDTGAAWLERALHAFPRTVWLNPVREAYWPHTASIGMIRHAFGGRMFPLTIDGLDGAMRALSR